MTSDHSENDQSATYTGTVSEFNVDWEAECGQLDLTHNQKLKIYTQKEETKTNASVH